MDELEISGKRYISTRRAAREHGYHSDYMGQLIRGKKVAGQKVGRAWYIEEDSLNVYLGKTPVEAPKAAAAAPVAEVAPPVERLVVKDPEPAPVVSPELQPEVVDIAPEPAREPVEIAENIDVQPIAVRIEPQPEPVYTQPVVQEIHHAPMERHETRIPIHTPAPAANGVQETGGLRYTADDAPTIPVVTRMPQAHVLAYPQAGHVPPRSSARSFPYISLSVVGIVAILAATFASNFVSATIVSEPGKAATVQYAIHW